MNNKAFSKIWIAIILLVIFTGLFAWRYSYIVALTLFLYIYSSLVLMALARKTQTSPAWLAWIPVANLYLLSRIARMRWWPFFLPGYVLGIYILTQVDVLEPRTPLAISLVYLTPFALLTFGIFVLIWLWRTLERVGRPGWWVLLGFIPGIGPILLWILLGVAAWGSEKVTPQEYKK